MTETVSNLQDKLATAAPEDLGGVALDGLKAVWPPNEALPALDPDLAVSFDKAMALIAQTLPGWGVKLDGTAGPGGSWICELRATGLRDDDEVIGIGDAETVPLAMMVALLQVLISRSKGYD